MFVASQSSAFAQSHTEPGSRATYHYDDWRKQPPQEAFDVAPAPAEGMHSFISRLDYPAELRRRRVTGTMRVSVTLDAAGQVQDVNVIQSVHPSLDRIVTSAIDQKDALDTSAKARCANRSENLFPAYI